VTDLLIGDLFTDKVDKVWAPMDALYETGRAPIPAWDAGTPGAAVADRKNELVLPDERRP
jgi:hypothetical protein